MLQCTAVCCSSSEKWCASFYSGVTFCWTELPTEGQVHKYVWGHSQKLQPFVHLLWVTARNCGLLSFICSRSRPESASVFHSSVVVFPYLTVQPIRMSGTDLSTCTDYQSRQDFQVVKCVVVGDTGTGKTRLICARACGTQYTLAQLMQTHVPTVWAIDHYRKDKEVREKGGFKRKMKTNVVELLHLGLYFFPSDVLQPAASQSLGILLNIMLFWWTVCEAWKWVQKETFHFMAGPWHVVDDSWWLECLPPPVGHIWLPWQGQTICIWKVESSRLHIILWSLQSNSSFKKLTVALSSVSRADVILACFSVVRPRTLRNILHHWYPEIQRLCPGVPIVLCGCQVDLRYLYLTEEFINIDKGLFFRYIWPTYKTSIGQTYSFQSKAVES